MSEPDPKTVREIARQYLTDDDYADVELRQFVRAHVGYIGGAEFEAWREAVQSDINDATVTKTATWPGEQPAAKQDGAAARVLAYLDDHRARYPYDADGVIADLPAAYDNGPLPHHELLEADLRAVAARAAEQDGDVRAVAEACADFGNDEGPRGIRQLYARFADRIAALDARDAKAER